MSLIGEAWSPKMPPLMTAAREATASDGTVLELADAPEAGLPTAALGFADQAPGQQPSVLLWREVVDLAASLVGRPEVMFLDEPTTGIDPRSRIDIWDIIRDLQSEGTTLLMTTQYLEEVDYLADRIGVINHGEVIVVEEKHKLMRELGKKELVLHLADTIDAIPSGLGGYHLELNGDGSQLTYHYDTKSDHTGITALLAALHETGIRFNDLQTKQSSLEEIFVGLVNRER